MRKRKWTIIKKECEKHSLCYKTDCCFYTVCKDIVEIYPAPKYWNSNTKEDDETCSLIIENKNEVMVYDDKDNLFTNKGV